MKWFIKIIMWVLFLFALFILIAFFFLLPREIRIEQDLYIEASSKIVFSQVNDLYNWEKWNEWHQADPDMDINYVKNGVGKSAGFQWESKNRKIGAGSVMILESKKYDSLIVNMAFFEKGEAINKFIISGEEGNCKMSWEFYYNLEQYPQLWWKGYRINRNWEAYINEGLANIKTVCEVQAKENVMVVELEKLDSFLYVSLRQKVNFADVSEKMLEMFDQLNETIQSQEIETKHSPFAIYHSIIGETIDMECGIPVPHLIEKEEVISGVFPAVTCAALKYYGNYEQLEQGHTTVQNWLQKRRFNIGGPPIEVYVTDPEKEPDSGKWLTIIYYPVY